MAPSSYSSAEVAKIRSLVATGLTYREVGERVGRSRGSLKYIMRKFARRDLNFPHERYAAENEQIVEWIVRGAQPKDIAKKLGWSTNRVDVRVARLGLREDVRTKLRRAMAQIEDPPVDVELRKAWDEALSEALLPLSLYERAEALDLELSRIESSARAAFIIAGRTHFGREQMKRIAALRQTLDLLCFLDRNQGDEELSNRIRELKKKEAGKYAPMELARK